MTYPAEIRMAPSVSSMNAFIEPYRQWMECVLGCASSDSFTFELELPFGHFAAEEILRGVPLERQCLFGADAVRPAAIRWELPPGVSPRIGLIHSRQQESLITTKTAAWDAHWKETPIAVWLKGLDHAVVAASIPYVSFSEGMRQKWQDWLIVNRAEVVPALNLLGKMLAERPKRITVIGGKSIPLRQTDSSWDSLVLDRTVRDLIQRDFEFFLKREEWFRKVGLPYRRGYLFYGPPGNGKTSAIRAMISHSSVSAFSLDFANIELTNEALSDLFEAAKHAVPSMVIFEDLDRVYNDKGESEFHTRITLQHLLNCLDGLGCSDGTIVIATANPCDRRTLVSFRLLSERSTVLRCLFQRRRSCGYPAS
jgi:ATPase family protein associated with various cellular activities (AAA)